MTNTEIIAWIDGMTGGVRTDSSAVLGDLAMAGIGHELEAVAHPKWSRESCERSAERRQRRTRARLRELWVDWFCAACGRGHAVRFDLVECHKRQARYALVCAWEGRP